MFEMRVNSVVDQIVRAQFNQNNKTEEALYTVFDVRMHDFSEGLDLNEAARIHVLYHTAIPHGRYISVFTAVTDREKYEGKRPDEIDWKFRTRHDSCWRDVEVFNEVYFDMAEALNAKRKKLGKAAKAPRDFSTNVFFDMSMGDELFRWVKVEVTLDPADTLWGHRRLVKVLK